MPTVITPAELAARAAAVRAERESAKTAKTTKKGKRAKGSPATDASTPTPAPAPGPAPSPAKGKAKIIDTLSPEALRADIDALLSRLRAETNADAKKKIRRALRLRGHRGGLSHERTTAVASESDTDGAEGG